MKRFSRNKLSKQLGFTLLETLVAMVIMTGGVIVLANAWSGNVMRIQRSRVNSTMASLLERKMTEIEITYKDKASEEIVEEDAGDFGPQFPGYKWEMTSQPFEMPDLSGAAMSKEGGADEITLMVLRTISEYIKLAVKEVNVSVIYKARRGTDIKNSVTSYFVDYKKEIPMPAGLPAGAAGGAGGGAAGGATNPAGKTP